MLFRVPWTENVGFALTAMRSQKLRSFLNLKGNLHRCSLSRIDRPNHHRSHSQILKKLRMCLRFPILILVLTNLKLNRNKMVSETS